MDLFGLKRRAVEALRDSLAGEGIELLEANVRGSLTRRNYREPGKRMALDKRLMTWTVIVTGQRLLVRSGERPYVDVAWSDQVHRDALHISVDGSSLLIAFDAGAFSDERSGRVAIRARVADPEAALQLIQAHR